MDYKKEIMKLAPKDLYQKLEFDKVLELLQKNCLGEPGKAYFQNLQLSYDANLIERQLREVEEYQKTYAENHNFPFSAYQSISEELKMLGIEGYVLSVEGLQQIAKILYAMERIYKFFDPKRDTRELYPNMFNIIRSVDFDAALRQEINRVIDEEGKIRPNASPELQRIARMQGSKRQELDKKFRQVAGQYQSKNMLADNVESFRNGRRVLAVMAEYKRQIRGILHDESASGKTVFIEPDEVIDLNNDLFDLEQEYRREIYRIMRELSAMLRPYVDTLDAYQGIMKRFDTIQAKGQLAYQLQATKPILKTKPHFKIRKAFHPLLFLKNKRSGDPIVPFHLEFRNDNRILILSGPNAGGKSICMKAVGLLQMMLQAGMLVPMEEGSEMGIFKQIFADIGDQQSLEDELSTYSSRLQNAKFFMQHANENTLVLIDEFGSGTDPKMGGAIAESILRDLNYKKVYGVITTHYSNLKTFAFNNEGLVNGHMVFNTDSLSPTYQMRIGRPGSSYAFEIADKSGLPKKIINYARRKVGDKIHNFDEMLVDLQKERKELEEAKKAMEAQQKQLDQLIKNYEFAHRELEFGRKKLKLQVKEQQMVDTQQTQKELQKLIRELREAENKQKARERAEALLAEEKESKEVLEEKVETIKDDIYKVYKEKEGGVIEVGAQVRLRAGGMIGTVKEIKKKEAVVELENLTLTVKLRDLVLLENAIEINQVKGVKTDILSKPVNFDAKLDIRGMRYDKALEVLQDFLDNALMSNAMEVRIVHGKGSGVLRKAVQQKLREYPSVVDYRYAEPEQGGDGLTIVAFG
jgi:DNA mismatch repair protein MutS2